MSTLTLKSKHEGSLIYQMLETFHQIVHHITETAPFYGTMEAWEAKEYKSVLEGNLSRLEEMKAKLLAGAEVFEPILAEYELTIEKFLSENMNLDAHKTVAISSQSQEIFRAWSKDWSISYVFIGSSISSDVKRKVLFNTLDTILGKGWGFERALTESIESDENTTLTKSGKAILKYKDASEYAGFEPQDHADASLWYYRLAKDSEYPEEIEGLQLFGEYHKQASHV